MLGRDGEGLRDRLTPLEVIGRLRLLGWMLQARPALRHHLRDLDPIGDEQVYAGCFQFQTWDDRHVTHMAIRDGKVRVGAGPARDPDVILRFREPRHLRSFFRFGSDALQMLLDNVLVVEGSQAHLLKFGAIAGDVAHGPRFAPPAAPAHAPDAWRQLAAPPVGEPCADVQPGSALPDPHLAHLGLDDLPAVKRLLWAHRHVRPTLCPERARLLTEFVVRQRRDPASAGEAPALRRARAIHHVLTHKRAILHDDDLLGGTTSSKRIGVVIYPETFGATIWPELHTCARRALNPYDVEPADAELLSRQVFPHWLADNVREHARRAAGNPTSLQLDERFVLYFQWKGYAVSHTIVDVPRALSRGLLELRDEARARAGDAGEGAARDQYRAMALALDGVLDYARRVAAEARAAAAELPAGDEQCARMERIAAACERVPARPARTLFEAIQAIWLLFLCQHQENINAGLSLGRLDVWLQPYLERDLAGVEGEQARAACVEDALRWTCALMLKCTDHLPLVPDIGNRLFGGSSSDQVITLGGVDHDGGDAVGDMTWIFLKATELLRLRDPNVNARYAPGVNPPAYLRRLCEVNLLTRATPSLHNDDAVVPSLVAHGFAPEHARDWSATGCVEPTSCGRHFGHTGCLMFNLVAPLEMALHDGVHPVLGERIGPRTGDPRGMTSYEQFRDAYLTQLRWLIDQAAECNNLLGESHRRLMPSPLLSALFTGPMESGKDVIDGGAIYNSTGVANVGLTDVVDSLCAIRTLVFDERRVEMAALLDAVDADFAGHEVLLARLLNKVPKFGQDHPLPRSIADELMARCHEHWQARPHYRGGHYVPGYWSMSNHVAFGMLSGALPSGRRQGKAFTPGLTPSPLCHASLAEQIRVVAGLDAALMPNNIAYNVKVVPAAGETHAQTLDRITAVTAAYFEMGGMQMQFNVVGSDTLRQAMEHPDEFRDLLVRISGYNAYFVDLNENMQLELIERTEHSLAQRQG